MKINGNRLAWAMIHFSFFLTFVFVDLGLEISPTDPFTEVFGKLIFYGGLWFFFGWRFIKNMEEAFK